MAEIPSLDSNVLSNARSPALICAQINCGGAATSYTVKNGTGVVANHTAGSNDVIITIPAKYGAPVFINANYVPAGAADISAGVRVGTDYNATTGKLTLLVGSRAATVNGAFAAMNDPTGVIYLMCVFQLVV